ncbi:hypothetical protein [Halomonas halophila]|nr:hypothetical protein [Halomonas halophila]WJY08138.1 hypothetical protein QWG60_04300 [Halomonas halophila]
MWFIQPEKNYVPEMPWERAAESEVMSWQIRVRDYNTLVANIAFLIIMLFSGSVWFFSAYSFLGKDEYMPTVCVAMFFLMTPVFMGMTHQTSIIVYRLTDNGYEKISWKPQIDSVKPVMKWTAIVSGIAVLVATFFNPYFILGAVGPAGFGLIALAMGNSGGYQKMARDEEYASYSWDEVEEVVFWDKRRLIGLRMSYENDEGESYSIYHKIYCKKGEVKRCLEFVRKKASSVNYVERKLNVYGSFAT